MQVDLQRNCERWKFGKDRIRIDGEIKGSVLRFQIFDNTCLITNREGQPLVCMGKFEKAIFFKGR